MGFFSFVGSVISSVGSAISTGIRAVGSAISTAVSSVGSALSTLAANAGPFLGSLASKAAGFLGAAAKIMSGPLGGILGPIIVQLAIKVITKVIDNLAKESGVVEKDDKAEEIGYRLEEAEQHEEWKKREDFSSFKEYNAYLKEQIKEEDIDYDKLKEKNDYYSLLGTQAELRALEEKYGMRIPVMTMMEIGRSAMEVDEVKAFIQAFKNLGYKDLAISEYLQGRLPAGELERITSALLDALKVYFPKATDQELNMRVSTMQRASRDDKFMINVYHNELQENYGEDIANLRQSGELGKDLEQNFKNVEEGKDRCARLEEKS